MRRLQELPAQQLFKYICDKGGRRQISSQDVNAYIQETAGGDFSSRQFRTWGATCMAVTALAPLDIDKTEQAIVRQLNEVVDIVASRLVNTRSVWKSSYIHPAVFEDFRAGRLGDVLRIQTSNKQLLKWMGLEEIRVQRWLKRRAQK